MFSQNRVVASGSGSHSASAANGINGQKNLDTYSRQRRLVNELASQVSEAKLDLANYIKTHKPVYGPVPVYTIAYRQYGGEYESYQKFSHYKRGQISGDTNGALYQHNVDQFTNKLSAVRKQYEAQASKMSQFRPSRRVRDTLNRKSVLKNFADEKSSLQRKIDLTSTQLAQQKLELIEFKKQSDKALSHEKKIRDKKICELENERARLINDTRIAKHGKKLKIDLQKIHQTGYSLLQLLSITSLTIESVDLLSLFALYRKVANIQINLNELNKAIQVEDGNFDMANLDKECRERPIRGYVLYRLAVFCNTYKIRSNIGYARFLDFLLKTHHPLKVYTNYDLAYEWSQVHSTADEAVVKFGCIKLGDLIPQLFLRFPLHEVFKKKLASVLNWRTLIGNVPFGDMIVGFVNCGISLYTTITSLVNTRRLEFEASSSTMQGGNTGSGQIGFLRILGEGPTVAEQVFDKLSVPSMHTNLSEIDIEMAADVSTLRDEMLALIQEVDEVGKLVDIKAGLEIMNASNPLQKAIEFIPDASVTTKYYVATYLADLTRKDGLFFVTRYTWEFFFNQVKSESIFYGQYQCLRCNEKVDAVRGAGYIGHLINHQSKCVAPGTQSYYDWAFNRLSANIREITKLIVDKKNVEKQSGTTSGKSVTAVEEDEFTYGTHTRGKKD